MSIENGDTNTSTEREIERVLNKRKRAMIALGFCLGTAFSTGVALIETAFHNPENLISEADAMGGTAVLALGGSAIALERRFTYDGQYMVLQNALESSQPDQA